MTTEELQTLLDAMTARSFPVVPINTEIVRDIAAELIAARAKLAAAEGLADALRPFSEAAEECDDYGHDDQNQAPVDAGQCRAAREALAEWEAAK